MTLRFRYHPEARAEVEAEVYWHDERGAGLGADFFREIEAAIESICEHPLRWPLFPHVDPTLRVRRRLVKRFSHAVAYLVVETEVVIVAVAHTSRRPGYWVDRVADAEP